MNPETLEINSLADIQPVDVDIVEDSVEVAPIAEPVEELVAEPVVEVKKEKPAKKEVKKSTPVEEVKNAPVSLVAKYNLKEVYLDHKSYKGQAFISPAEISEMNQEYSCVKISGKYYYHK